MSCEYSISGYLASFTATRERIAAIDVLIDKALLLMLDNVEGAAGNISSYELDDGQVRIKTMYRSVSDITASIDSLEKLKIRYENKLYGRKTVLRDRGTIRGGFCC